MTGERARVHHLIPEFFIARFGGDDGRVLVTDKVENTRKLIHPRVLMTQRDYYTVETVEGPSDTVERWLSTLEGATADVLRRIERGAFPPRGEDLDVLSMFVAFQLCRGRELQSMLDEMTQGVTEMGARLLASVPDAMRAAIYSAEGRIPEPNEIAEHQAMLLKAVEEKRIHATVPRPMTVKTMTDVAPKVAMIIAQRSWDIYESDEPVFITGDMPVALWSPPLPDGRPMPVGVMTADEITFPIDAHRCVLLGLPKQGGGRYAIPPKAKGIQHLNERHYIYARRFTFQHPQTAFEFDDELARRV